MKTTRKKGTKKWFHCTWHDDYYGKHHYGVEFPDGTIIDPREVELETRDNTPEDAQLIAVLQNLQSSMQTASTMLKRCGHSEHADELMGASDIVQTWIEGIHEKK